MTPPEQQPPIYSTSSKSSLINAAFLVEHLTDDVIATDKVVAVRDKHRSVGRHHEETSTARKWRLSKVYPYIPGYRR